MPLCKGRVYVFWSGSATMRGRSGSHRLMGAVSQREALGGGAGGRSEGCRHRSNTSQAEQLAGPCAFQQGAAVRQRVFVCVNHFNTLPD